MTLKNFNNKNFNNKSKKVNMQLHKAMADWLLWLEAYIHDICHDTTSIKKQVGYNVIDNNTFKTKKKKKKKNLFK